MTFTPGAELQHALLVEIRFGDGLRLVIDDPVVDARTAAADQPPGFAIGSREAGEAEELEGRHAAGQFVAGYFGLRQFTAAAAALENGTRGLRGSLGGLPAVAECRGLGRQDLFCFVDVAALQLLDPRKIQFGEEAQKARDIRVFGVSPKLPIRVWRKLLSIQPNGTLRRLAHLGAG